MSREPEYSPAYCEVRRRMHTFQDFKFTKSFLGGENIKCAFCDKRITIYNAE